MECGDENGSAKKLDGTRYSIGKSRNCDVPEVNSTNEAKSDSIKQLCFESNTSLNSITTKSNNISCNINCILRGI